MLESLVTNFQLAAPPTKKPCTSQKASISVQKDTSKPPPKCRNSEQLWVCFSSGEMETLTITNLHLDVFWINPGLKTSLSTQKAVWGYDPYSEGWKHMGLLPVLWEVKEGKSKSPKGVLPLLKAVMRELMFGQMVLLGIQLEIEVTWSPAASDIPIAFKMLHSQTGLTDPMLEQVENHRTGPKIQGECFSVVNKNNHNPLPPLPHTDRHTGLYTACKPTPSENT